MTEEEALDFLLSFDDPNGLSMVFSVAEVIGFHKDVISWAMNDEAYTSLTHYQIVSAMVHRQYSPNN